MICEGAPGHLGCRCGVQKTLTDEPNVLEELKEQKGTKEAGGSQGHVVPVGTLTWGSGGLL